MIAGVVNERLEPLLRLLVRGPGGEEDVEAVLDTGFDGSLSLPSVVIARLGLVWQRRGLARLADGRVVTMDVYEAALWWEGTWRRVAVDVTEAGPLAGTRLLRGCEVRIDFVEGGAVEIRPRDASGAGPPAPATP